MGKDTFVKFARWSAVLPGSILAILLSSVLLHLVLYQTLTGSGIVEPYPETPERILQPLAATLAFIWAGSRIAPSRKIETAVVLFAVMLLCSGASLALSMAQARFGNVSYYLQLGGLPVAAGIAGAFVGLYIVRRENFDGKKLDEGRVST